MAGQPNQRLHPFGLRLLHDGLCIFAMPATLASEYEDKTAQTAVEHHSRDIGQNELPIPRRDASGNEQDPRRLRNSPRLAQGLDPRRVHRHGIECGDVDAARNDGEALARNVITREEGRGGEVRRGDHPISARERGGPIAAQPGGGRHVEQRGDEPHRDPRRRQAGDPSSAGALRVHDVDALGGDQALESAGAPSESERIDGGIDEGNPFAARCHEFRNERALFCRHQRSGTGLPQRGGDVERGAGDGFLAQSRDDLQDCRANQGGRVSLRVVIAHGVHSSAGAGLFAARACMYSMAACGQPGPMPDAIVPPK